MFARTLRIALLLELIVWLTLGYRVAGLTGFALFLSVGTAMLVVRILPLLLTFMIAWYFSAGRVRLGLIGWLRFIAEETGLRLYLWLLVFPWDFRDPDPAPDPLRTYRGTVLLAHGYYCNRLVWKTLRRHLEQVGWHTVTLNLEPVFAGIDDMVPVLAEKIAGLPPGRVVLLCHSMGALVAREYLSRHGAGRVERLLTLGAPHQGTWLARFGPGKNARQMEPGSDWMRLFGQQVPPVPVTVIYSEIDNIVLPQENGRLPGSTDIHHIVAPPVGHMMLLFSPVVVRQVLAALDRPADRD